MEGAGKGDGSQVGGGAVGQDPGGAEPRARRRAHLPSRGPWFDADFEVTGPPELVAELRRLAARYDRATGRSH